MNKHIFFPALLVSLVLLSGCFKKYDNPAVGTPGSGVTVYALRQAHQGSDVTLGAATLNGASTIQGVVISDRNGKNFDANSFVLQQTIVSANAFSDVTRGIVIRMNAPATYNIGDSLQVNVEGTTLTRIKGMLTINNVGSERITQLAAGKTPLSRAVTAGILANRMDEYEGTLVTINADVVGASSGGTLSGTKQLNDNSGGVVYAYTMPEALHASTAVPADAQFGGITGYYNESGSDSGSAKKVIMPRNAADIQNVSGVLYTNFPEGFESPDASAKTSYNVGTNLVTLNSGSWTFLQAIFGNTAGSDRYNIPGKQSVRMQQNLTTSGYLQMNFDVPDGASKVTVFYGRYSTDAKSSFRLEYSTNGGTTWTATGANISNEADKLMKQAVWLVNFTGPVRFRINKLGTGTSNNGRINFDDFAVYKKP